jgi:hypothetical protein
MTDTNFLKANKLFQPAEIQTYQSEQDALRVNYERLKQQRREREAQPA